MMVTINTFHYPYIIDALRLAEDHELRLKAQFEAKADEAASLRQYGRAANMQRMADRADADATYYRAALDELEEAREAQRGREAFEPDSFDSDDGEIDRILSELDELMRLVSFEA